MIKSLQLIFSVILIFFVHIPLLGDNGSLEWSIEGEFCKDGIWRGVKEYTEVNKGEFYGSYCNGDKSIGRVQSSPFEGKQIFRLHLIGNFSRDNINIYLIDLQNQEKFILTENNYTNWAEETWQLPNHFINKKLVLVAEDNDTTHGGWLAFSLPSEDNLENKQLFSANEKWIIKGEVGENCIWKGAKRFPNYLLKHKGLTTLGTYCNGDASKGEAISPEFTAPSYLKLYLIGSFSRQEISIHLEVLSSGKQMELTTKDFQNWSDKTWKLPEWVENQKIHIKIVDRDTTHGGWGGVSQPVKVDINDYTFTYREILINWVENNFSFLKIISIILFFCLFLMAFWGVFFNQKFPIVIRKDFFNKNACFLFLAFVVLTLYRLPRLLINLEMNPDESQMLSQAMKLSQFPVFWKDVDGTTGGPLLSYYLTLITSILGMPYDYITARIAGLLLLFITVGFTFFALKNLFSTSSARIGAFMLTSCYAFATQGNFFHYSSEHLPVAILAIALYLYSIIAKDKANFLTIYGAGFLIGLTPFTKLQSLPIFFVVAIAIFLSLIPKWKKLSYYIAGGLTVIFLFVIYLFQNNLFDDFFQLYIKSNLLYTDASVSYFSRLMKWKNFLYNFNSGIFKSSTWIVATIFLLNFIFLAIIKKKKLFSDVKVLFILVLLLATIYGILKPDRRFLHYLHLLAIPTIIFITFSLYHYFKEEKVSLIARIAKYAILGIIIIGVFLDFSNFTFNSKEFRKDFYKLSGRYYSTFPEKDFILSYTKPHDKIAIWGWNTDYYVHTKTMSATRDGLIYYAVDPFNLGFPEETKNFYRNSYLKDLAEVRPRLFVDATGPNHWAYPNNSWNHERKIPELKEFIQQNYFLVGKIGHSRIYTLKENLNSSK